MQMLCSLNQVRENEQLVGNIHQSHCSSNCYYYCYFAPILCKSKCSALLSIYVLFFCHFPFHQNFRRSTKGRNGPNYRQFWCNFRSEYGERFNYSVGINLNFNRKYNEPIYLVGLHHNNVFESILARRSACISCIGIAGRFIVKQL